SPYRLIDFGDFLIPPRAEVNDLYWVLALYDLAWDFPEALTYHVEGRSSEDQKFKRCELRLLSWGDGAEGPTSGNDLVIIGIDNKDQLRIRIFDADGDRETDTAETSLPPAQAEMISSLKQQLPGLLSPQHVLSEYEKIVVIAAVTS